MTTKTIKISIVALLSIGIISSVGLFNQNSFATDSEENTVGKDIIVYTTDKEYSPERIRMNEIANSLNTENLTESEKTSLYEEANEIRQKVRAENTVPDETKIIVQNAYRALDDIGANNPDFASSKMFDILVGFGIAGDKLIVDVKPEHFNQEKLPEIIQNIRTIVGNQADIEYASKNTPKLLSCTSQTSSCSPLEGGVSIEGKNHNACSSTFQADDNGSEGFITAGHCVDAGSGTSDDVFQPTESGGSKIGDVNDNAYDSDVKCDCAFVEASSISDKIFSNIAADGVVSTITMDDFVTLKGKTSGTIFAQVSSTSYSSFVEGNYHRDHFEVDEAATFGDSGGPGYETNEFTPLIHGVISFGDESSTALSKAKHLSSEISGVDWDFS